MKAIQIHQKHENDIAKKQQTKAQRTKSDSGATEHRMVIPCHVTSTDCDPSSPNTTQECSSVNARWTSSKPSNWQAATTLSATPKLSSLLPETTQKIKISH